MSRSVAIVGAGPAGLAAAFWRLRAEPDAELALFEAAPRAGGWVRSELRAGHLCEHGPQAVRPGEGLPAIAAALGIEHLLVPSSGAARRRWIARGGRLLAVPTGPLSLLGTRLLSARGKLRLLREPRVPRGGSDDETVAAFAARRFGAEVAPLVQAMVAGVFAGDATRLEVASAFPLLHRLEREHGSVLRGLRRQRRGRRAAPAPALCSFRGGMQVLVDRLAASLGDRVATGRPVTALARDGARWAVHTGDGRVHRSDELVLACPAHASARLLAGVDGPLAAELAAIPFASLASVWLGFEAGRRPARLRGFGFLMAPGAPTPVLGAIYCTELFGDHAPPGHSLVRVLLGGVRSPDALQGGDDQLAALAESALREHTGLRTAVTFRHVVRAGRAIPQYERGHAARLARIGRHLAGLPGLSLCGNSYRGVALGAQLADGAVTG